MRETATCREIAIRIALGLSPANALARVLRQGLTVVVVGVVGGLLASFAAGRLIRGILFGVAPLDPVSIALVVTVLAGAAAVAIIMPASRAARTDPQVVLRGE